MSGDNLKKKLAIVGWASSSRDLAPYDDEAFDIWGCNELGMTYPKRFTAWFNLHAAGDIEQANMDWLNGLDVPVWVREPIEGIPKGQLFPFDEVMKHHPHPDASAYHNSTIDWQLAFALSLGQYEEIHLYGVDMALDGEYEYQRPACEYWIGYTRGLGINMYVAPQAALLKTGWIYALEDPPSSEGFITQAMVHERLRDTQNKLEGATAAMHYHKGAMDVLLWGDQHIQQGMRNVGKAYLKKPSTDEPAKQDT